jgi:hypothetical protein
MIYRKFSNSIDEKLKNYILKLNNSYLERWKQHKSNSKYIQDLQMDIINNSSSKYNKNKHNYTIIIKPYIFYYWLMFSFLSGYQFRSLIDRFIYF